MKKSLLFAAMMLFMAAGIASAQMLEVHGTVVDASTGEPVPFAAIQVQGTTTGATTDADGAYTISVDSRAVLVFSSVGYVAKEVPVAGRSQVDCALDVDATSLDDVVIVAYGTAKKESFTGSVAVVKEKELEHRKVSNVTKALDGLAPGVQVTSGSGQPGSGSTIVIRGFGSINASSSPLYVVDGVPYDGAISAINPDDIASISILKDASASVLYGSRGANGVVIINTKKGKSDGKVDVSLRASVGISSRAIPRYETVGAKDYMEIMYSAFYNTYGADVLSEMSGGAKAIFGDNEMYNPYNMPIAELYTSDGKIREDAKLLWEEDWLDQVTDNTALRQEYGLSVSGGKNATQYMFSLGYLNEDGVLKTTNFERYTGRLNVETNAKAWFAAGLGANFARSSSNTSQTSSSATSNVFFSAQNMAPIFPVYQRNPDTGEFLLDAAGEKQFDYGLSRPAGQQSNFNSVATLYDDKYSSTSYSLSARAHIDFMGVNNHWSEGLKFQMNFGTDYRNASGMTYYNPFFGNAESVSGRIYKTSETDLGYTFNQLLSYNRYFGDHNVDVLAGHEFYSYNTSSLYGHKTGLPGGDIYELDAAAVIAGTGSSSDNDRIESFFTRLGYSYDDRYFVSASWRTDGSSRFAPAKRWGNFWSAGASWNISNENFMQSTSSWLNSLLLKVSYGVQGNNSVGSYYAYQALYDTSAANATNPGAVIANVANEDLTWESSHNLNAGIEARFLGRIDLSFEYYNRTTTDMLLAYPLATSTGFGSYYRNSGSMRNSGIEFALTGHIFKSRDLNWSVTWMGSTVDNKVLKLTEDGKDIIGSYKIIREGETLYSYYVARSAGVNPINGNKMYWATDDEGNDYITEDTSVAQANRVIAGSRIPALYGSLSTAFNYKGIDLSVSTNYSIGGKNYDGVYNEFMSCYYVANAKHKDILRAWRQPGDITDVPRYKIGETPIITDDKLVDASYFSIKNITLGYTFPQKWTSRIGLKALRLAASVDNLCIFTRLKGMDPQYSLDGGTSYAYAPTRTVSFTLDIKF